MYRHSCSRTARRPPGDVPLGYVARASLSQVRTAFVPNSSNQSAVHTTSFCGRNQKLYERTEVKMEVKMVVNMKSERSSKESIEQRRWAGEMLAHSTFFQTHMISPPPHMICFVFISRGLTSSRTTLDAAAVRNCMR